MTIKQVMHNLKVRNKHSWPRKLPNPVQKIMARYVLLWTIYTGNRVKREQVELPATTFLTPFLISALSLPTKVHIHYLQNILLKEIYWSQNTVKIRFIIGYVAAVTVSPKSPTSRVPAFSVFESHVPVFSVSGPESRVPSCVLWKGQMFPWRILTGYLGLDPLTLGILGLTPY